MWTAHFITCLSPKHTHTDSPSTCVCVWICVPSLMFFFFSFGLFIRFLLHGRFNVSEKILKENPHNRLSFPLGLPNTKSASVFQLSKPQWHYFYIQMGQKIYLYINIYKCIHANIPGVQYLPLLLARWNNTTTNRQSNLNGSQENGAESDCRAVWNSWVGSQDKGSVELLACMHQSFTGHLQRKQSLPNIYSLTPQPSPLPCIIPKSCLFISIITYTKSTEAYYWI